MDELTRERYGRGVPQAELYARPSRHPQAEAVKPVDDEEVARRRIILCGTDDLDVMQLRIARDRRLVEAIRTWVA